VAAHRNFPFVDFPSPCAKFIRKTRKATLRSYPMHPRKCPEVPLLLALEAGRIMLKKLIAGVYCCCWAPYHQSPFMAARAVVHKRALARMSLPGGFICLMKPRYTANSIRCCSRVLPGCENNFCCLVRRRNITQVHTHTHPIHPPSSELCNLSRAASE
jgi:hypothetical protein